VADVVFNVTGANAFETILSFGTLLFSAGADWTDDGQLGLNTADAAIPAIVGAISPDPLLDAVIDSYGSLYNHDYAPGIASSISSLFSP